MAFISSRVGRFETGTFLFSHGQYPPAKVDTFPTNSADMLKNRQIC
jgi:hypothetical protein